MHLLSLTTSLAIFWLVLSGYTHPLLLAFGAASCLLTAWLCHRMDIVDHEGHPNHMWSRMPGYWLALVIDTLQSNVAVAKILLSGRKVHPVTGYISTPLNEDITRATLANSITLTPGTLALDVEDGRMRVHALEQEFLDDLKAGAMIRRAQRIEA